MKNRRTAILCACLILSGLCATAQTTTVPVNEPNYNKPTLFQNLPASIPVSADKLNSLFTMTLGRGITVDLSNNSSFQFAGTVVSKVSKYENSILSIVIKSTNYNGASLSVSKITSANGSVTYTGRILSFQHADLFQLEKQNDQFMLVKKKFYDLVNE
jgi:hypothetical protein